MPQKAHLYLQGKCNPVPSLPGAQAPGLQEKLAADYIFAQKPAHTSCRPHPSQALSIWLAFHYWIPPAWV